MIKKIRQLLEMIRFSHTVFALPFAMLGAVLAWAAPPVEGFDTGFRWQHLVGILVCMVGARSAAMAFNRIVDRRIDAMNPRTKNRHLPAGSIGLISAINFTVLSSLIFVGGTLLFLPNPIPLYLAVPVLLFLCGYSFTKRFTSLAHFWLGLALSLAPVCAWLAIRGPVVLQDWTDMVPSIAVGLAVTFWVAGFDMIYACQDYQFDRESGLQSIPTRFGIAGALRLAAACHFVMVVLLAALPILHFWAGPRLSLGWVYGLAVAIVGVLLVYEHGLVRPDDLTRVNVAFFNINAIVSIGLFVVATLDLFVI